VRNYRKKISWDMGKYTFEYSTKSFSYQALFRLIRKHPLGAAASFFAWALSVAGFLLALYYLNYLTHNYDHKNIFPRRQLLSDWALEIVRDATHRCIAPSVPRRVIYRCLETNNSGSLATFAVIRCASRRVSVARAASFSYNTGLAALATPAA